MSDQHADLRSLPLSLVIPWLGIAGPFKERKGGQEWFGKCPFHGPKNNNTSFSFHQDGRFNCFSLSCGKKGRGAIDFVMAYRGVGFQAAVDELKAFNGAAVRIPTPQVQKQLQQLPAENASFKGSYEKFAVDSRWLKERGLTQETLKRFEVFEYNNPKRRSAYSGSVMLKIRRYSDGECVGYLARNIGEITQEKPKYRFPANFQKGLELFGAWQIKNDPRQLPLRVVYVVESPFAVMHFDQLGFPAVSPFGWAVSEQQLNILGSLAKGCCYLPDRNVYGQAAEQAGRLAGRLWTKMIPLPSGIDDPEKLTAEQIRALS